MIGYLENKRILFFGPQTFNYEREIVRALERMGSEVIFKSDKPWKSVWLKAVIRLWPKLAWIGADRSYRAWLNAECPKHVDIVFVVKGEGLSPSFLSILRKRNPSARFVLYLWDSIANVKYVEQKFFIFDSFFSFDPYDCERHKRFKYRPLFFLDGYRSSNGNQGAGCFFLGTLNGDRPRVIARLIKSFHQRSSLDYWLFVRSKLELRIRLLFDSALRELDPMRFLGEPMSSDDASSRIARCAAVLDIEHPNQTGLTMRTFEVLASGRKLVTTNKTITHHEFYDPSRICLIDRHAPKIPEGFLESDAVALPDLFFERYSICGWLREILSDEHEDPSSGC